MNSLKNNKMTFNDDYITTDDTGPMDDEIEEFDIEAIGGEIIDDQSDDEDLVQDDEPVYYLLD